jgi:hypothetical protein
MLYDRITSSVFEFTDSYIVRHDRTSGYVGCTCPSFSINGKCEHLRIISEVLKAEGRKVVVRRSTKFFFIDEIDSFKESAEKVLNESTNFSKP